MDIFNSGAYAQRLKDSEYIIRSCTGCPRNCEVDRLNGELGYCQSGSLPIVSSYAAHHGEEPVLSGTRGAGNIFFGNCNLRCIFCQNFEISQNRRTEKKHEISCNRLSEIMIELQNLNCHNIGLVSPTHFSVQILNSIYLAIEKGLHLPIIYNTNGYDSVEMLKLYEGIADIYLPDFKYGENDAANRFSKAENYFDYTCSAVKEMFRQVGDELIYEDGIAVRGLIIRHLVLPNGLADSEKVFRFISEELSPNIHISLMAQYYPANKSYKEILLDRPLRQSEYEKTVDLLEKYKLHNGWIQEIDSSNYYRPDFRNKRDDPFEK